MKTFLAPRGRTPTVGVFFDDPGFLDYPFNQAQFYNAYHELAQLITDRGGKMGIVRSQETYHRDTGFRAGWWYRGEKFEHTDRTMTFDVLFNRGHLIADASANVINERELERICTDKSVTYALFREHCPMTFLVRNPQELSRALAQTHEPLVVAKPLDKDGGEGVIVGDPVEIAKRVQSFPYLVQEFIDTRCGIPGIVEGMHDLRFICVTGEIVLCYTRTPKPGSFLANQSQGGIIREVPLDRIPAGALHLFEEVESMLRRFRSRVYSLDIGLHEGRVWKIIELNARPGLSPIQECQGAERFLRRLADLLLTAAGETPKHPQ